MPDGLRIVIYIKTSSRSESETGDIINLGVEISKEVYNKDMISHKIVMKFLFNAPFEYQTCQTKLS